MSDRRPATTIGELDIHLWNVMQKLEEVQTTLGTLATKNYVDEQVRLVKETIQDSKPSTQIGRLAKFLAAVMVISTFVGFLYQVSITLHALRESLPVKVGKP
jgi:hypothetical protein